MAVPTTYSTLKTELATLSVRDDLDDMMANYIGYAENWFQGIVFTPEREASTTVTTVSGVAALPADFYGVRTVWTTVPLRQVTPEKLRLMFPNEITGTPYHFAIEGENLLVGPIANTTLDLHYWQAITPLSDAAPTNWLLTDHPDLYVNAALSELYEHTRDYAEADRRRAKAQAIVDRINRTGRRKTHSGPLVAGTIIGHVGGILA